MTAKVSSDYFELSDYVGAIRRRWPTVVLLTLIGTALAASYYVVAPKTYTASALIQVNALPTNANALGGRTGGPVNMDNEAQVVKSTQVASLVKARLRSPLTPAAIAAQIRVAVPPNTTFLQVSCAAPSAVQARDCANATGAAYLYNRRVAVLNLITSGVNALQTQANALQTSIETLQVKLRKNGLPAGSQARLAALLTLRAKQSRLATVEAHINSVTPLRDSLSVKTGTVVGVVVTPAALPAAPTSPRAMLILPTGLAAGLVIGLMLAFYRDRKNPRAYAASDLERLAGMPAVVDLRHGKVHAGALAAPSSPAGQAFGELARFAAAALGDDGQVLAVAEPASGSGGTAAANLAIAFARTRGETILLCRGARGSYSPLAAADGRGFAELLAGTAAAGDVARGSAELPGLRVISFDADGGYDLQYERARQVIADLRRQARYVLVEMSGDDTVGRGLAELADGAIVVASAGQSRIAEVTGCVRALGRMRTTVLGVALLAGGGRRAKDAPPSSGRRAGHASGGRGAVAQQASYGAPSQALADAPLADAPLSQAPASDGLSGGGHLAGAQSPAPSPSGRGLGDTWTLPRSTFSDGDGAGIADR